MKLPGKTAWLSLSLLVILLDQLSKQYLVDHLLVYETIRLLPVFNIAMAHNTGAAFSMLAGASGWQRWFFVALAVVITGLIVRWLATMPAKGGSVLAAGLALVAGGAIGNVVDRLVRGYVIDFLQFHWQGWFFPAFNLADSCITVGAALLLYDTLILQRKTQA